MKTTKFLTLGLLTAMLFSSCEKEEQTMTDETSAGVSQEFSKEFLAKLERIEINPKEVRKSTFTGLDGITVPAIDLGDDLQMTMTDFNEMMSFHDTQLDNESGGKKQYVTPSRVSQNRTIRVLGYTGAGNALSQEAQKTLQWSVNNFNNSGINLRFTLDFGTNYEVYDMVVYYNPVAPRPGVIASAGFPSGGRPNKFIQMFPASRTFQGNGLEAIITHEMGHSVGFRHTDWFSRESCGLNQPEGRNGAVYVPGTPRGYDPTSIMLACAQNGADGEFNNNDLISLRAMYPR